jgi:hypothetical protein
MPAYTVDSCQVDILGDLLLLDTGILVAKFLPEDGKHDDVEVFLDMYGEERQLAVPIPVVIEAWGLLVGSKGRWDCGMRLLLWLSDPGNSVVLLSQHTDAFDTVRELSALIHVDYIDASLSCLANDVTRQCDLSPHASVATYDTGDFLRCRAKWDLRFRIFDLKSLHEY